VDIVIAYLREENRALQVQLAAVGCDYDAISRST